MMEIEEEIMKDGFSFSDLMENTIGSEQIKESMDKIIDMPVVSIKKSKGEKKTRLFGKKNIEEKAKEKELKDINDNNVTEVKEEESRKFNGSALLNASRMNAEKIVINPYQYNINRYKLYNIKGSYNNVGQFVVSEVIEL